MTVTMKMHMGVSGKYRHAVTVLQAHPCMYNNRHRHSGGSNAAAKVTRSGTDGVQGQRPATLTLLARSSVLHLLHPGLLFGEKRKAGVTAARRHAAGV